MPIIINNLGVLAWGVMASYLLFLALTSFFESAYTTYSRRKFPEIMVRGNLGAFDTEFALIVKVVKWVSGFYITLLILSIANGESHLNDGFFILSAAFFSSLIRLYSGFYRCFIASQNSQITLATINGFALVLRPCLISVLVIAGVTNLKLLILGYILTHILEMVLLKREVSKLRVLRNNVTDLSGDVLQVFIKIYGAYCFSALLSVYVMNADKLFSWIFQLDLEFAEYSIFATVTGLFYVVVNSAVTAFNPVLTEKIINKESEKIEIFLCWFNALNGVLIFLGISLFVVFASDIFPFLGIAFDDLSLENLLLLTLSVALNATLWMPVAAMISAGNVNFVVASNGFKALTLSLCLGTFFLEDNTLSFYSAVLIASVISTLFLTLYMWFHMKMGLLGRFRYLALSFGPPALILAGIYFKEQLYYFTSQLEGGSKLIIATFILVICFWVILSAYRRGKLL